MNRIFITLMLILSFLADVKAQVPNFAGTAGKDNIYGYFSFKSRPGINSQETYRTILYGATNCMELEADYYTGLDQRCLGLIARFGKLSFCKNVNVGVQFTPSFDLQDEFKWSCVTSSLYINGDITFDGKLFYLADKCYTVNKGDAENAMDQWLYLTYSFQFNMDKV